MFYIILCHGLLNVGNYYCSLFYNLYDLFSASKAFDLSMSNTVMSEVIYLNILFITRPDELSD